MIKLLCVCCGQWFDVDRTQFAVEILRYGACGDMSCQLESVSASFRHCLPLSTVSVGYREKCDLAQQAIMLGAMA